MRGCSCVAHWRQSDARPTAQARWLRCNGGVRGTPGCRCCGLHCVSTVPLTTSTAANSVVVQWRMSSCDAFDVEQSHRQHRARPVSLARPHTVQCVRPSADAATPHSTIFTNSARRSSPWPRIDLRIARSETAPREIACTSSTPLPASPWCARSSPQCQSVFAPQDHSYPSIEACGKRRARQLPPAHGALPP